MVLEIRRIVSALEAHSTLRLFCRREGVLDAFRPPKAWFYNIWMVDGLPRKKADRAEWAGLALVLDTQQCTIVGCDPMSAEDFERERALKTLLATARTLARYKGH